MSALAEVPAHGESGEGKQVESEGIDMGGGPSHEQNVAAKNQAALTEQTAKTQQDMLNVYKQQLAKIDPFATSRLNQGLPFFPALTDYSKGTTAQAFQPAYAALNRRFASMGALPSGFKAQAVSDLDAQRARAFDSQLVNNLMLNETARNNAAAMLTGQQQLANPLGWTGAAMQGNQSIMNAPLASPGIGGVLGGLVGGAASGIPF